METPDQLMLIDKDILKHIQSYETTLYQCLQSDLIPVTSIQDTITNTLLQHYQRKGSEDPLQQSRGIYLRETVRIQVNHLIAVCQDRLNRKRRVVDILETLKTLVLPEQRSPEWYQMREGVLTASSLADALGKGHFNTREGLLIDKTSTVKKPFFTNPIMEWGVKYEHVATQYYESLYNLHIVEFGLVPHKTFPIFGASPDGICDTTSPGSHVGRMLEIKCPPKRQFTAEVPEHYWMQIQGQLETCDLEECDFFQVKLEEYRDSEEYALDICEVQGTHKEGYSKTGHPKGCLLTFESHDDFENPVFTYRYPPLFLTREELQQWKDTTVGNYVKPYQRYVETWWRIERYECTLVLRDVSWWRETMPQIIDFWEDVVHYRKVGNQSLIDKRDERKHKRKITVKTKPKKKSPSIIQVTKQIVDSVQSTYMFSDDE
jgi:putative phage-type endonuclease